MKQAFPSVAEDCLYPVESILGFYVVTGSYIPYIGVVSRKAYEIPLCERLCALPASFPTRMAVRTVDSTACTPEKNGSTAKAAGRISN
ncbi:hypothetical protein [Pseudarthrobacter sp. YAF2]|uniref:hypothetical protein n=1 Tax=Pseudarthrobacter sp. YAF2 TaxID=3233078 RepID=UPI003F988A80